MPLIITIIIVGLMLININYLTSIYHMSYLKWMAIIELSWTIILYMISWIVMIKEKVLMDRR